MFNDRRSGIPLARLGVLAAAFTAACASAPGNEPPVQVGPAARVERTRSGGGTEGGHIDITTRSAIFVSRDIVAAPLDSVWAVLPDVWKSLGLTVEGVSSRDHRLQSGMMRIRRQLGGVSLSRYIECGRTTLGQSADIYFIALTVETVANGTEGQVLVQSSLNVTGEGTGNGGTVVRCSTTGELERRIAERVTIRLKK